jgi:Phospholipid-translocating ATPase N-terminal
MPGDQWVHDTTNAFRKRLGLRPILLPHEQEDRTIFANAPGSGELFTDNVVTTSRYTWYNFVPVFLFNQFTRFANAYFLCVAILQTIPEISITNGVPTTFLPLSIVLGFDGLVTAREDYKRHQDDAKANASQSESIDAQACISGAIVSSCFQLLSSPSYSLQLSLCGMDDFRRFSGATSKSGIFSKSYETSPFLQIASFYPPFHLTPTRLMLATYRPHSWTEKPT